MINRAISLSRNTRTIERLLLEKCVPHRVPDDVVAIVSSTVDMRWSPVVTEILTSRLMGLKPMHIFHIISAVYRQRQKSQLPVELLEQMLNGLIDEVGKPLDPLTLVRGIEMVRELSGPAWDPNNIAACNTLARMVDDNRTPLPILIRLLSLGGNWDTRALIGRLSLTTSSYDLARVAYLTGDSEAFTRATGAISNDSLAYLMRAAAAWNLTSQQSWMDNVSQGMIEQLSPRQAQVSLWSGLVLNMEKTFIQRLETVANRESWRDHSMYEQYRLLSDPEYKPQYPIRIPQLAVDRKHRVAQKYKDLISLCGLRNTRQSPSDSYLFDICVNDSVYIDIVTYPNDPNYRIYKKLVDSKYPVIEMPADARINSSTINDIVRLFL